VDVWDPGEKFIAGGLLKIDWDDEGGLVPKCDSIKAGSEVWVHNCYQLKCCAEDVEKSQRGVRRWEIKLNLITGKCLGTTISPDDADHVNQLRCAQDESFVAAWRHLCHSAAAVIPGSERSLGSANKFEA
jgi:hypothetical protein